MNKMSVMNDIISGNGENSDNHYYIIENTTIVNSEYKHLVRNNYKQI